MFYEYCVFRWKESDCVYFQLFHSVVDEKLAQTTVLHLVGVVCYYNKH